jgi:hypothetical protein
MSSYPSNASLDALGTPELSNSVIVRIIDDRGTMTPSPRLINSTLSSESESSIISNHNYFSMENADDTDDEEEKMQNTISTLIRRPSLLFATQQHTLPPQNTQHMKLILVEDDDVVNSRDQKKNEKTQIDAQHGKCPDCSRLLSLDYGWIRRPRYCHYTNKYYCMNCMNNTDKMPIPAKIVANWDFTYYRVSTVAHAYLKEIIDRPVMCISAVNPLLFDNVVNLKKARMIRKRLNLQWDVIEQCPLKDDMVKRLHLTERMYYVNDTEVYSLNNLIHLQEEAPFLKRLANIFHEFADHITKHCSICKHKGQHQCPAPKCNDHEPIYTYNITHVIVCPSCKKAFHKKCFKNNSGIQACPCCSSK